MPILKKPVPGFSRYQVTKTGKVWDTLRKLWISPHINFEGYPTINLWNDDNQHRLRRVHTLVLLAYVGPCPKGLEARHEDENKTNCNLSNLSWSTRKRNLEDRVHHNVRQGNSKLTVEQVMSLRKLYSEKTPIKVLCSMFNLSRSQTFAVALRYSWKHL